MNRLRPSVAKNSLPRAAAKRSPARSRAKPGSARPNRFVDDYLAYLLARASHEVSREFRRELESCGLAVLEWRVLATLHGTNGCSLSEVAEAVLFKQPTVTKLIDRMERDGWVKRLPGVPDRRRVRIVMTQKGQKVVGRLLLMAKRHEDAYLARYDPVEIDNLKRILRDLIGRNAVAPRP